MSHFWVVSSCKPAKHTSKGIMLDLNIFNFNCTLNSVTGSGHVNVAIQEKRTDGRDGWTDGQTDATKCIISLASRSIINSL